MYFRQGDEIGVHFPIQVDLPEIQELLNVLKQFEFRSRVCTNLDLLLKTTYDYNKSYMDAIYALQRLAFHIFYPWKTAKSSANRRVFVQEGGFQTFMEIFKFSFYSHYSSNQAHEAVGQGNRYCLTGTVQNRPLQLEVTWYIQHIGEQKNVTRLHWEL